MSFRQSTLSFGARRTTATTNAKKNVDSVVRSVSTAKRKAPSIIESDGDDISVNSRGISGVSDIELSASDEDSEIEEAEERKPTKKTAFKQPTTKQLATNLAEPVADTTEDVKPANLNIKDKKWDAIYKETQKLRNSAKPIHPEGQDRIHEILNTFDHTAKYGPYVGMTRLERWQRAHTLGLNPPSAIRDILDTQQGQTDPKYSRSGVDQDFVAQ